MATSIDQLLDDALATALAAVARSALLAGPEVESLLEGAGRAVTGGKRLRARLCLAAAAAVGTPSVASSDPVVRSGAALELFQAAALVHDDLMDGSDTRRGAPSAHRWFEQLAPRAGAEAARLGEGAAVLLGDLLLTMSSTALHGAVADLPVAQRRRAGEVYADLATEVAFGQYLDLLAAHAPWDGADLDRAWRVIHAKTARYSVELPLVLGAVVAGADDATLDWFAGLGREVGTAFQLRDDLLGVLGDPEVTGKPSGEDVREGKRTVLVALAHAAAGVEDRALLERSLGSPDLTAAELARVLDVLTDTGAVAEVERLIAEHLARARAALATPPPAVRDTVELAALVSAAVERSA